MVPKAKEAPKLSNRAKKEQQQPLFGQEQEALPTFALLDNAVNNPDTQMTEQILTDLSNTVEQKLSDFSIAVKVCSRTSWAGYYPL